MTEDEIKNKIREYTATHGGRVSFRSFLHDSGIQPHWLRRQGWFKGWNALLVECGLPTRDFSVPRTPSLDVAEAVAEFIEKKGGWPTDDELVRERVRNRSFPSIGVVRRLRRSGELAKSIVELNEKSGRFPSAASIARSHKSNEADATDHLDNDPVKGYVYLLSFGRRFKLGRSNDPSRRFKEVRLLLPEETRQVHAIPTDDPVGIERYWKERFADKRVRNTEFFDLLPADIRAFKRRKYQ